MKPTDIAQPDYFHKVVDCQWACPAHTAVPEYIRLIAAGRYADAYLVNWESNVFPGILGRTCDRPCEPACRRGRVEEGGDGKGKPEPVAICRLKRVAADYKDDIRDRLPARAVTKNGKRIALVGAGPASLTVARDLAPLGYECVVFDGDAQSGGMMRTQIPKFRLPESVIDEETGYVLDLGVDFRPGQRIDSLKALLAEKFDAVFIGSGAPRGRDIDIPGRREAAAHIKIGIDWLSSVSFGHTTSIGKRVVVLGGGNTAMDCCRSSRRLGGEQVDVVVRSGFDEMKASPWEKEDAMHEGIPIHNFLVPKAFTHEGDKLTGVTFEKVEAKKDAKGRRQLVPTGEPDVHFPCDDVLVAIGQENAFPWIERDLGIEFDEHGMPVVDSVTMASTRAACSSAATRRSGPRTSSGRSPMATPPRSRSTSCAAARTSRKRPPPHDDAHLAEDGHSRVELRQRHRARAPLPRAAQGHEARAEEHQDRGRARLRPEARVRRGAALPELRRADGVHRSPLHRVRCVRRHLPDGLHQLHRERRGSPTCGRGCAYRRRIRRRTSTCRVRSRPGA